MARFITLARWSLIDKQGWQNSETVRQIRAFQACTRKSGSAAGLTCRWAGCALRVVIPALRWALRTAPRGRGLRAQCARAVRAQLLRKLPSSDCVRRLCADLTSSHGALVAAASAEELWSSATSALFSQQECVGRWLIVSARHLCFSGARLSVYDRSANALLRVRSVTGR